MTEMRALATHWTKALNIRAINSNARVIELSGGNQQKVVIAKSLVQKPKLIIFDEPTRGVDVGAIAEIHQFINRLADDGLAVVVISSYLPEVMNLVGSHPGLAARPHRRGVPPGRRDRGTDHACRGVLSAGGRCDCAKDGRNGENRSEAKRVGAGRRRQVNRLPPERRIADILLAARDVFTEKGYNEALISDIAERAGVVEGSIYRFFSNKRDLLVKTVEHWYEDMLAHDEEQFHGVRGTWNRIRFIVHDHLLTIRREPALSRLVFQELAPRPRVSQHASVSAQPGLHASHRRHRQGGDGFGRVPIGRLALAGARHDLRRRRASHLGVSAQRGRVQHRRDRGRHRQN